MRKGVILLLLAILFLYGCTTQAPSGVLGVYANCNGDDTQMVTAAFADFAPVSLETSPYQAGEDIDVEVILVNKHSEDIDAGSVKVKLTGEAAMEDIFSGADVQEAEMLYAIDPETCLEEDTEIDMGPIVYEKTTTTTISKEITGSYCYAHDVVVKGFLYLTADATEIGDTLPTGSNPPSSVQVTMVEQNPVDVDADEASMRFKIYLENVGEGTIVEDLDECFEYRDTSYREEFTLTVDGPYTTECPEDVKLSRGERTDVVTCKITDIDTTNLGDDPIEFTITLSGFAYEDEIPSTTIWVEP